MKKAKKPTVLIISSFPPKKCGIACFTHDLFSSLKEIYSESINFKICPLIEKNEAEKYKKSNKDILNFIEKNNSDSFIRCAEIINKEKDIKLVNIQHEYGLFGSRLGSKLVLFLEHLKKPSVISLHSVIGSPNAQLKQITAKIAGLTKRLIVMNKNSKQILIKDYQLTKSKISVIPHGVHSFPYEKNLKYKEKLKLKNRKIILTFGFLSQNKGIEYVLKTLPEVVKKFPSLLYIYLGQTHPQIIKNEGEKYRNSLEQKIKKLKLQKNVIFINQYKPIEDLLLYLKACDIYFVTNIEPTQAVSGTFSYAISSGRPVISTNFIQAKEYISPQTGILVPPKDIKAYTHALIHLLDNYSTRTALGRNAYFKTRKMIWPNVALAYFKIFSKISLKKESKIRSSLPSINLKHINKLTDDFGIIQFAKFSEPKIQSGYTVDDNARALILSCLFYKKTKKNKILNLIKIYLNFLHFTYDERTGYFKNYVKQNKEFDEKTNNKEDPEDQTARAFYALSRLTSIKEIPVEFRNKANLLIEKIVKKNNTFSHSRSIAFLIKGYYYFNSQKHQKKVNTLSKILIKRFKQNYNAKWKWFENQFSYANATIPEALILSYLVNGKKQNLLIGRQATDFLLKNCSYKNCYTAMSYSCWYKKDKRRAIKDQQPEDTCATIELLKSLYQATGEKKYKKQAFKIFNWFLGDNNLRQFVYDHTTGGCYDGINKKEVNLNQGAESTISYLLSRLSIEELINPPQEKP
ncbi:MAG: glycosyltransferase [Candidatus Moranbacteria bacterium]|nr:glycosyltransferase [Candidatus Moranbacteria bacterium]